MFLAWPIKKTVCESEKQNFVTSHLSVTNCIHTCLPGPVTRGNNGIVRNQLFYYCTVREFFYQGSGELQHFKRFCFEKNIIGTTCRFTPKTMNLITSYFVTCLCNTLSGLQMHFTKAHPKLATYSILFMRSRASVATHGHEMSTRSIIGNHVTRSRYFDVSQSIIREVCMCYMEYIHETLPVHASH